MINKFGMRNPLQYGATQRPSAVQFLQAAGQPATGGALDPLRLMQLRKSVVEQQMRPQRTAAEQMMAMPTRIKPTPAPSLNDRISGMMPAAGTPQAAGLGAAGARMLQLSGYSDRPIPMSQILGEAAQAYTTAKKETATEQREETLLKSAAERQARLDARQARLDVQASEMHQAELAKIASDIETEKAKGGKIFSGTSFTAQSYNSLIEIGNKIKDGTASEPEKQAYSLIYQKLSMPEEETRQTDAGVVTVKRPAMDLSGFPTPAGVADVEERIIGEKKAKFSEGESKAAGFANRIKGSLGTMSRLEAEGYDASNLGDFIGEGLPAPLAGLVTSNEGQQYQTAKADFITSVLRKESGAAIADSEFVREDKKYFPQPNDTADTIAQKARMREKALESMIAQSGAAYEVLFPEEQASLDLPKGSKLLREIGNKKYYETPDGDILVVD